MAYLHYANLGVHRPDILFQCAQFGLRDFAAFLSTTIAYLENEAAVLRLAWSPAAAPERSSDAKEGFWIELREPTDRPNEPQRTFDAFVEDDVREVYEHERKPDAPSRRVQFDREHRVEVLDRDPYTSRLLLDRRPDLPELCLRPNTATLKRQREAVRQLQDAPSPAHLPLLRLFEGSRFAHWPAPASRSAVSRWYELKDLDRPGTASQRAFVEKALRTPDFAFLEGPPGSGKTTAICELVLQLVGEGKRVLLCGSTHVAVDNVLERLGPLSQKEGSELIPVRVGERRKVSDGARPWQLEELARTERRRIVEYLRAKRSRTPAQDDLLRTVARESSPNEPNTIERMILDAANLVCGTTTGILRHPDIDRAEPTRRGGMFDVLILDEASKTTFQEFLVPALLAKRWVIVGDVNQLSPFVDDEAIAANLTAALPDPSTRDACVDVFLASRDRGRRAAWIADDRPELLELYRRQARANCVEACAPSDPDVGLAEVVLGTCSASDRDRMPADLGTLRGAVDDVTRRRVAAYLRGIDVHQDDPPRWESELGWRLCRRYELRRDADSASARRLDQEILALRPAGPPGEPSARNVAVDAIDRVRRIAFPSVLESLQHGFERRLGQRDGTALTDGLPPAAFAERHVLLEHQHRMHPDISALPREHVYAGKALKDPDDMAERRAWSYPRYQRRATFLHVDGRFDRRGRNAAEAAAVIEELKCFHAWARGNPRNGESPWEVAVLTFYRGQERELRERLRKFARAPNGYHRFTLGEGDRVDVHVELCTVDRFQGHEADLVFVSIANVRATSFLESVNRLNVAVTRARYQRVVVGHRHRLRTREGSFLHRLTNEAWELSLGGER